MATYDRTVCRHPSRFQRFISLASHRHCEITSRGCFMNLPADAAQRSIMFSARSPSMDRAPNINTSTMHTKTATQSHAATFKRVINIPVNNVTGTNLSVREQTPKGYGLLGLSEESAGGPSSRTCQYQYQPPTKRPTQKVTEKIIKIQGVNTTPTQRKKKNPAVNASFFGESTRALMSVQGGIAA